MNILFILGRVAFVLIFIVSGIEKLVDIPGTAALIGSKVEIPDIVAPYVSQLETAAGMELATMLAILTGVVELIAGLMIAAGIGMRVACVLLILFTIATVYYFHNFWAMTGNERAANVVQAMKNLSLIGGLLMLFVLGRWKPKAVERYDDLSMRL
jgi:putative oxidoreductase